MRGASSAPPPYHLLLHSTTATLSPLFIACSNPLPCASSPFRCFPVHSSPSVVPLCSSSAELPSLPHSGVVPATVHPHGSSSSQPPCASYWSVDAQASLSCDQPCQRPLFPPAFLLLLHMYLPPPTLSKLSTITTTCLTATMLPSHRRFLSHTSSSECLLLVL